MPEDPRPVQLEFVISFPVLTPVFATDLTSVEDRNDDPIRHIVKTGGFCFTVGNNRAFTWNILIASLSSDESVREHSGQIALIGLPAV